VIDDLEEDEEDGGERRCIDEPSGEVRGIGRGNFLGEDGHEQQGKGIAVERDHAVTVPPVVVPAVSATLAVLAVPVVLAVVLAVVRRI